MRTWKVLVAESCRTLWTPWTVASVYGILQTLILEWVAIPLFRGFFQPRDPTLVSCIAGRFFTVWATSILPGGENVLCSRDATQPGTRKLACKVAAVCGLEQRRLRGPGGCEGSGDSTGSTKNAWPMEVVLPTQSARITRLHCPSELKRNKSALACNGNDHLNILPEWDKSVSAVTEASGSDPLASAFERTLRALLHLSGSLRWKVIALIYEEPPVDQAACSSFSSSLHSEQEASLPCPPHAEAEDET